MPSKVPGDTMEVLANEEAEERQKEMRRTPVVREDLKLMEAKARVSQILQSATFHQELQHVIQTLASSGTTSSSLMELQQISSSSGPMSPMSPGGARPTKVASANTCGPLGVAVTAIADLQGSNQTLYEQGERELRCKVACFYRLADIYGMMSFMRGTITARRGTNFLVNSLAVMPSEVTAGSLLKVSGEGELIDRGNLTSCDTPCDSLLPRMIMAARADVQCVAFCCELDVLSVSCMKGGVLPFSQEALLLGRISYHDYIVDGASESVCRSAVEAIRPESKVLIVRNLGAYILGESVAEAFTLTQEVVQTAKNQMRYGALGNEALTVSEEIYGAMERFREAGGSMSVSVNASSPYGPGERTFEAYVRCLDMAGHRTGYLYKLPVMNGSASQLANKSLSQTYDYYMETSDRLSHKQRAAQQQQRAQWITRAVNGDPGAGNSQQQLDDSTAAAEATPRQMSEERSVVSEEGEGHRASAGEREAGSRQLVTSGSKESSTANTSTADMSASMQESMDSSVGGGSSGGKDKKKKFRIASFSSKKK